MCSTSLCDTLDAVRVMGEAQPAQHPGMAGRCPKDNERAGLLKRKRTTVEGGKIKDKAKGSGAAKGRPVSLRETMAAADARLAHWALTRPAKNKTAAAPSPPADPSPPS